MDNLIWSTNKYFKDITGKRLHNLSQLQQFGVLKIQGHEYFFNIFETYQIVEDIKEDDKYLIYHNVDHDEWWDYIAYKYYDNEQLWWIIAMTNDVLNPFEELMVGEKIKIIDYKYIMKIIKSIKKMRH